MTRQKGIRMIERIIIDYLIPTPRTCHRTNPVHKVGNTMDRPRMAVDNRSSSIKTKTVGENMDKTSKFSSLFTIKKSLNTYLIDLPYCKAQISSYRNRVQLAHQPITVKPKFLTEQIELKC